MFSNKTSQSAPTHMNIKTPHGTKARPVTSSTVQPKARLTREFQLNPISPLASGAAAWTAAKQRAKFHIERENPLISWPQLPYEWTRKWNWQQNVTDKNGSWGKMAYFQSTGSPFTRTDSKNLFQAYRCLQLDRILKDTTAFLVNFGGFWGPQHEVEFVIDLVNRSIKENLLHQHHHVVQWTQDVCSQLFILPSSSIIAMTHKPVQEEPWAVSFSSLNPEAKMPFFTNSHRDDAALIFL